MRSYFKNLMEPPMNADNPKTSKWTEKEILIDVNRRLSAINRFFGF